VIISRDADYGVAIDKKCHLNDRLRQEFKKRVSSRRKVVLFDRLTDGLKYFKVPVSKKAVDAERDWIRAEFSSNSPEVDEWVGPIRRVVKRTSRKSGPALLLEAPLIPPEEEPPANA
jgi:hypothetical protein